MDNQRDDALSTDLAPHLAQAREALEAQMAKLGLTPAEGWSITEEIRSSMSGTVIVLKPIHLRLTIPPIEQTVQVGHDGRAIDEPPPPRK